MAKKKTTLDDLEDLFVEHFEKLCEEHFEEENEFFGGYKQFIQDLEEDPTTEEE